ncbi:MAG: magnesium transporter CorA family protein [bacterium]|nr:magnesium transporter CorA family protein [bacterium]
MRAILAYDQKSVREGTLNDLKRRTCTWVHYWEPTAEELQEAASSIGLETEELSDLLSSTQRPTLRDTEAFSVVVTRSPRKETKFLTKPVVLAVSKARNDLISVSPYHSRSIERVHDLPNGRKVTVFAAGATSLLFTILDEVTASYFNVFERMDDEIDRIERNIRNGRTDPKVMEAIYGLKKTLIYFHKALVGNREVLAGIEKAYAQFVDAALLHRFRVLHDQTVQLVELGATYRDILTSTLEVHLSVISNALNITMKKVTSWGAIILVPSLVAGIYGMNFHVLPGAGHPFGFVGALVVMVISVAALYWYFRKHDYL